MHSQQDLALAGLWVGQLLGPKWLALGVEHHRAHAQIIAHRVAKMSAIRLAYPASARTALVRLDDLVQRGALGRLAARLPRGLDQLGRVKPNAVLGARHARDVLLHQGAAEIV